ncbi:MAG: hypothetical protein P8Z35_03390, partial [Ignavibacteriaceae bacterium]
SFWGGLLFLILPQNILNVLWISGRTDLICGFFSFLSIYLALKFIISRKNIFLVASIISFILAYMSKETAIIINLYIVCIFIVIKLNKKEFDYKKIIIPFIVITAIYLIIHASLFHLPLLFNSNSDGIIPLLTPKFYIYGIWDFFIPISILDLIYLFSNTSFIFYSLILLLIIPLVVSSFLFKKYLNNKNKKIITLILFTVLISLFIYYANFPQMRLMYVHYVIILLGLFSIEFLIKFNFIKKLSLFIPLILLLAYGNYLIIKRTTSVDYYYKNLVKILPSIKDYKKAKMIYILTPLTRISESPVEPNLELLEKIKYKVQIRQKNSKFEKIAFYEGYSLSNIGYNIEYKSNRNNLYINLKNRDGIVPNPSKKFIGQIDYKDEVNVKPLEYQKYRPGFASKVLVEFKNISSLDSCQIIYLNKGKLKLDNLEHFLKIYSE